MRKSIAQIVKEIEEYVKEREEREFFVKPLTRQGSHSRPYARREGQKIWRDKVKPKDE